MAPRSVAVRDANFVPTLIAVSDVDFLTPVNVAANPTTGAIDISGTISATNPSVSATAAVVPASATYIGANKAGNLVGLTLDGSGNLNTTLITAIPAGTNNIGVVDIADTGGNKLTTNSTTYTAKFALDVNLLGTLGTAFTTVGKVDVKGADGDVFVRSNAAATFPVNATQVTSPWVISGAVTESTLDAAIVSQGTALGTIKTLMTAGSVTTNAPTYTTGQIDPLSLTTAGGLRIDLKDTAANTNNLNINLAASAATVTVSATNLSTNIAQINGVTPLMGAGNTGTGSLRVTLATDQAAIATWGKGATGSAVPSGAQYEGFNAATALPTAGSAGNLTGAMSDKFGRQVVLPVTVRDLVGTQTTTISASTTETTIVSQAASTFNDLIMLVCSNTSATAARLDFRDTTAGSILFSLYLPAGDTRGFSLGGVPIPQTTVNTNWTAQSSASVTDLRIYAVFVKNK